MRYLSLLSVVGLGLCATNALGQAPADHCASAPSIAAGTYTFNNTGAGTDVITSTCGGQFDAWYKYVPAITGTMSISTCGSSFNTVLGAYDGCGGRELACNVVVYGNACGNQSAIQVSVVAGSPVLIRVDGHAASDFGAGTLNVSDPVPAPINDTCANALTAVVGSNPFDTTQATGAGLNGTGCPDVWFVYTPASSGICHISTCGSTVAESSIEFYSSCPNSIDPCPYNFYATCRSGSGEDDYIQVQAGTPVYIRVSTGRTSTPTRGSGVLTIDAPVGPPLNDNCSGALTAVEGDNSYSTVGATLDGCSVCEGDCSGDIDVWFAYTPSASGVTQITTCGQSNQGYSSYASIFDGCGGNEVACGANISACGYTLFAAVTAGHTYYIRVAADNSSDDGYGRGTLTISTPMAFASNDNCAHAAIAVPGDNAFNTTNATNDGYSSCEPTNYAPEGDPDVWFTFSPPLSGVIHAQTCKTQNTYTLVAAYTGGCNGSEVACGAAGAQNSCGGYGADLSLSVTGGQAILFRVASVYGGPRGPGVFTILCPADFNADGSITVGDIFVFLSAWFSNKPSADINGDGHITVADIFAFLDHWFARC